MNSAIRDNLNFLYGAPACRVYHNAAQAASTGVALELTLNSERFDNDTMHDTVTANSRITIKTAGRYLVIANVDIAANATGYRQLNIQYSVGSVNVAMEAFPSVSSASDAIMNASTIQAAAVNDFFITLVTQTSGGNLNINSSANFSPEFMACWMGN